MTRAAIYIRVSTDEQATQGNSLKEQEERLRAYCRAMGWDEVDAFIDDGYSAGTLNRPKLIEMLAGVRKQQYNMVITTKIDRLCRNLLDLLTLIDEFETYHCGFASSSESFDTSTPAGRMVLQILGAFAEFERGRIRERVRDNMRSIARNTDKVISRPCFGYDIIDRKFVINEKEAEIVRQMAQWMIAGEGALKVAKRLNQMGILTKDGNTFTGNAVRKLMKRETLYGAFIYNRVTTRKGKQVTRPKEEWIVSENHHEGILDKETFERLQFAVGARTVSGKQADNERWLLSGIIKCAHCGTRMTGRYKKKPSGREYFHYVCRAYTTKGECFHHYILRDDVEAAVISSLLSLNDKFTAVVKRERVKLDMPSIDVSQLENKLKSLDRKMQRQIELYEDDEISKEDFRVARDRIDSQRKELQEQIKSHTQNSEEGKTAEFLNRVSHMADELESPDRNVVKNAIRQLVLAVFVKNGEEIDIQLPAIL